MKEYDTGGDQASQREEWMPTRRTVLRSGAVLVGLGIALSACGGPRTAGSTHQVTGPPQKGGTLRVGFVGGGASDTLDAAIATNLGAESAIMAKYYNVSKVAM